jgi:hypothetical protein
MPLELFLRFIVITCIYVGQNYILVQELLSAGELHFRLLIKSPLQLAFISVLAKTYSHFSAVMCQCAYWETFQKPQFEYLPLHCLF